MILLDDKIGSRLSFVLIIYLTDISFLNIVERGYFSNTSGQLMFNLYPIDLRKVREGHLSCLYLTLQTIFPVDWLVGS